MPRNPIENLRRRNNNGSPAASSTGSLGTAPKLGSAAAHADAARQHAQLAVYPTGLSGAGI